jgi:2-keto-4-pentenoate hydratase/2-oxohepta-3-ene-1,7-dioic acid hydratase in catechol pathway
MQYATLKNGDLAAVREGRYIPFGTALIESGALPAGASMIDFIARYSAIKDAALRTIESGTEIEAAPGLLDPPVRNPSKIWAAARNYPRELSGGGQGDAESRPEDVLEMAFLKPPSAVVGPDEAILLPPGVGQIFPEVELCIVIGSTVHQASRERALEAVFGYTIILDVTARQFGTGRELGTTRCVRKAFDTFAPLGPCITTADEIPDPRTLGIQLWLNGEHRYSARLDGMLNGVAELVSFFSQLTTLYPGDLIATGNPNPTGSLHQLSAGDELRASIEGIGELRMTVRSDGGGS